MHCEELRQLVARHVLPIVQTPGQYVGGEWNAVAKEPAAGRGTLCLAFPDAYSIGMSNSGMAVLYHVMNRRDDWACQRAFAPGIDAEAALRAAGLPLYGLESFTPLVQFDVLGFSLQHELCYTNVLTMLDLGDIPLDAAERTLDHPLVVAGGPSTANPEPLSRFIDAFVIGDGEEALPALCDAWRRLKAGGGRRAELLVELARTVPNVYVPSCYEAEYDEAGAFRALRPLAAGVPETIQPAVVADLDAAPLPVAPVVPLVECVQDRISIEIMRGCPWRCRFCQSTTTKRPLRFRRVETIVAAALEMYRNTGHNEISLLSLSTSDYPHRDELVRRLQETFRPLGVGISVPSLRVNEHLAAMAELLNTDKHSGLTLAPEAARDAMRRRLGKAIVNEDLYAGCRLAFGKGFHRAKLYFMCGLPGETDDDLDGIYDMAREISRIGKETTGRFATVVASVSNFVPKPQTPFQWNAMQTGEYFRRAHRHLWDKRRYASMDIKCHDVESSLLEGLLARGDRRIGEAILRAWRAGARFDSWTDRFRPDLWRQAIAESGISPETIHRETPRDVRLPWDHIGIRQGRGYLEREHAVACAVDADAANGAAQPGTDAGDPPPCG